MSWFQKNPRKVRQMRDFASYLFIYTDNTQYRIVPTRFKDGSEQWRFYSLKFEDGNKKPTYVFQFMVSVDSRGYVLNVKKTDIANPAVWAVAFKKKLWQWPKRTWLPEGKWKRTGYIRYRMEKKGAEHTMHVCTNLGQRIRFSASDLEALLKEYDSYYPEPVRGKNIFLE